MIRYLTIISAFCFIHIPAANADSSNYGIYTNIQTKDGEPSGFEMYLLNNGHPGKCYDSVLFQSAEGWPQEPELLDCCGCSVGNIQFESVRWGKFKGVIHDGILIGEFVGLESQVKLAKGLGFWQR